MGEGRVDRGAGGRGGGGGGRNRGFEFGLPGGGVWFLRAGEGPVESAP